MLHQKGSKHKNLLTSVAVIILVVVVAVVVVVVVVDVVLVVVVVVVAFDVVDVVLVVMVAVVVIVCGVPSSVILVTIVDCFVVEISLFSAKKRVSIGMVTMARPAKMKKIVVAIPIFSIGPMFQDFTNLQRRIFTDTECC